MKIAVTSMGNSIDSNLSEQFGRCPYFVIFDTTDNRNTVVENEMKNQQGGVGPQAAGFLIGKDVKVLLTGKVGGNAESALKRGGVETITGFSGNSKVKEVIDEYLTKKE